MYTNNDSFFPAHTGLTPTAGNFSPAHNGFVSANSGVTPIREGFAQADHTSDFASTADQFPTTDAIFSLNSGGFVRDNAHMPGKPAAIRLQPVNDSGPQRDAYEQWLRNSPEGIPALNDPYLKELIRQYSQKSRAAREQEGGARAFPE